jgi:hypothetical protein
MRAMVYKDEKSKSNVVGRDDRGVSESWIDFEGLFSQVFITKELLWKRSAPDARRVVTRWTRARVGARDRASKSPSNALARF